MWTARRHTRECSARLEYLTSPWLRAVSSGRGRIGCEKQVGPRRPTGLSESFHERTATEQLGFPRRHLCGSRWCSRWNSTSYEIAVGLPFPPFVPQKVAERSTICLCHRHFLRHRLGRSVVAWGFVDCHQIRRLSRRRRRTLATDQLRAALRAKGDLPS